MENSKVTKGSWQDFWNEKAKWSDETFGNREFRGPQGPIAHLEKEVQELKAEPYDILEYVDCIFLIFDAARRAGFTYHQLFKALWTKLRINKARTWGPPSEDGVVEHVEGHGSPESSRVEISGVESQ